MRYLKVILLVVLFFISMVFFFQNQTVLSTEMTLKLDLFFVKSLESIPLPFYFLVLAAFLTGAILSILALVWDKMSLTAKYMKATWQIRSLEKELTVLKAKQEPQTKKTFGLFNKKEVPALEKKPTEEKCNTNEDEKSAPANNEKQRVTSATPEDFGGK